MNDAAYAAVVSAANELFLEALDLSAGYRATGRALYTVEMTIRYLGGVRLDDLLLAETRLISHDAKRMRVRTTLRTEHGPPVATGDVLYLHVDAELGRVVAMDTEQLAHLDEVQARHDSIP
jgi:acyl-CoA thioesterase FadM